MLKFLCAFVLSALLLPASAQTVFKVTAIPDESPTELARKAGADAQHSPGPRGLTVERDGLALREESTTPDVGGGAHAEESNLLGVFPERGFLRGGGAAIEVDRVRRVGAALGANARIGRNEGCVESAFGENGAKMIGQPEGDKKCVGDGPCAQDRGQ